MMVLKTQFKQYLTIYSVSSETGSLAKSRMSLLSPIHCLKIDKMSSRRIRAEKINIIAFDRFQSFANLHFNTEN